MLSSVRAHAFGVCVRSSLAGMPVQSRTDTHRPVRRMHPGRAWARALRRTLGAKVARVDVGERRELAEAGVLLKLRKVVEVAGLAHTHVLEDERARAERKVAGPGMAGLLERLEQRLLLEPWFRFRPGSQGVGVRKAGGRRDGARRARGAYR